MLSDTQPDEDVMDSLYLASLEHARTQEEIVFRDLLIFHRSWLNGAFEETLVDDESVGHILAAYRSIGLATVARLIEEVDQHLYKPFKLGWRAKMDALNARYMRLTYGEAGDQPDAIEAAAFRYAQAHEAAFGSVVSAAERGDYYQFDLSGGS